MTSLAPWLSISNAAHAIQFYKEAFNAIEVYRLEADGVIARLSVDGAEFWVTESAGPPFNGSIRMILTVAHPDALFAQALAAGATQIFPVSEDHGWRLGRLADPFGLHWEIGRPATAESTAAPF